MIASAETYVAGEAGGDDYELRLAKLEEDVKKIKDVLANLFPAPLKVTQIERMNIV